ncbi:MAG: hypothetical protein LBC79_05940 [Deltaproteobacteria bacterium]|jgi:hypothetical protein|nr:hypothetical protein [Deltaproteobacteria bacterium]
MNTTILQRKTKRMSGWALCLGVCALLSGFAFAQPGHVLAAGASAAFDRLADTKATMHNWKLARDYERQMRYELARQHYLLALASCRSEPTQTQLRRELEGVDLQIRTMR